MDRLIALLKSPASSLTSQTSLQAVHETTTMLEDQHIDAPFEVLPSEIIHYIFTFLLPVTLANVSATSNILRSHAHNELLWENFVRQNVPAQTQLTSPAPARSWRHLYLAHHPYWFLTRYKIWFSDQPHNGGILIARYNPTGGTIEAHRLLARQSLSVTQVRELSQQWSHNPAVHIHEFRPEIRLWLHDPVVKLELRHGEYENLLQKDLSMETGVSPGVQSSLSLCQYIPPDSQYTGMAVWPPTLIPAVQRVRNESASRFKGKKQHRPTSLGEASDQTFRIRRAMGVMGMGEEVSTWSTLLEETYAPTQQKPWQGVFVGDYSAHGCEFLLVMQKDKEDRPRLRPSRRPSTSSGLPSGIVFVEDDSSDSDSAAAVAVDESQRIDRTNEDTSLHDQAGMGDQGRLVAIKLTGDVNVPRGEITFVAEDIGDGGLLRVAEEEIFQGARVVKSMGHVADRGFESDRFIASQLIMKDHNTLAQYWERYGHISFYKRFDIDKLLASEYS